jgi:hypothetical protein
MAERSAARLAELWADPLAGSMADDLVVNSVE